MRLDADGRKLDHRFVRGLMRSRASLTYGQVQAAVDGRPDAATEPLLDSRAPPALGRLRRRRTAPARSARRSTSTCPSAGSSSPTRARSLSVAFRERLDAHRLIEEFMILANVAAAETLEAQAHRPCSTASTRSPSPEKLDALREIAETVGLTLAKGQVLQDRAISTACSTASPAPSTPS